MRILIVEDESLLANRLAATLGERGYVVDIARDGERGDFLASTEPYDAVILDLGLPRVDGLTLLERWRADDRDRARTRISHPDGIVKGSLRARLFVGALVWMTAVFVTVTALLLKLAHNHPELGLNGATYHIVMGIFVLAFVVGGLILVRRAVAPLWSLRDSLSSVREGRSQRIEGDHPSEVQPLVDELNGLLEDRERAVARAFATAGDLAHGLKTPLAVLAQEAERARAAGHHDLATTLGQLVERMQRQVDYHLARARATASVRAALGLRCSVLPSVEGLVRTMRRLHAERELRIEADVSPAHEIRGRREDLDEMLGNLLDNACKWARSRVAISSAIDHDQLVISVDDDGPGLDPSMRAQVLQRGVRADQRVGGSGLGLAIVSDLAELYGGSVTLETSPLGGTHARLQLLRVFDEPVESGQDLVWMDTKKSQ